MDKIFLLRNWEDAAAANKTGAAKKPRLFKISKPVVD